jgi:uncharacterized membrane protein YiaA
MNYEFSSSQNELIGDLAKKMTFVATLSIVVGIVILIFGIITLIAAFAEPSGFPEAINMLIQGIFFLLIGTWTRKAGLGFKGIITTAGSDIENLMGALGELRKLYRKSEHESPWLLDMGMKCGSNELPIYIDLVREWFAW